jgi:hypothetical protein
VSEAFEVCQKCLRDVLGANVVSRVCFRWLRYALGGWNMSEVAEMYPKRLRVG